MNCNNYLHDISLTEIADVKRVKKNDILPKGTLYIQVSACKKSDFEIWNITEEEEALETKYAYLIPKVDWNPLYVKEVLEKHAERFITRYVGKNINISMDLFQFYKIDYHWELETQNEIASILGILKDAIFDTENKIENCKKFKQWGLNNMFAEIERRLKKNNGN